MSLWTNVLLRYSNQILKELTNVDLPGATTIDTTKGIQAADDAEAWFKRVAQTVYDNTNTDHIPVAVRATYTLLREYSGRFSDVIQREREVVEAAMNQVRDLVTGKRITPWVETTIDPSDDENVLFPDRPLFDTERFGDVTPNDPPAP